MSAARRAALATLASIVASCGGKPDPSPPLAQYPAGAYAGADFPAPDRPVAEIVSPRWDDEASRDRGREADTVMRLLGVGPGSRVADVGAGDGYYAVRLSPAVGATGRVYAEDIMPAYLSTLRARVRERGLANVEVIAGTADDPRLPARAVDVALMVHMYHEIERPYALLANLLPALRPGARLAVLDLDRPPGGHGTPPALLRCELAAAGFAPLAFHDLGALGYLAVFSPGAPGTAAPDSVRRRLERRPCTAGGG